MKPKCEECEIIDQIKTEQAGDARSCPQQQSIPFEPFFEGDEPGGSGPRPQIVPLGPESGMPSAPPGDTLRPVLESLMAKLEQLGERPIEVSVTTLLDGRQVARSVYRDLRERKIKNYETL